MIRTRHAGSRSHARSKTKRGPGRAGTALSRATLRSRDDADPVTLRQALVHRLAPAAANALVEQVLREGSHVSTPWLWDLFIMDAGSRARGFLKTAAPRRLSAYARLQREA